MAETLAKFCGQRSGLVSTAHLRVGVESIPVRFVAHTGILLGPETINTGSSW